MLVKLVGKVRLFVALQSHREKWKLRFYVGMRQNFVMFLLNQINFRVAYIICSSNNWFVYM